MPKMRCKCDHLIDLSGIPGAHEWLMISEEQHDRLPADFDKSDLYDVAVPIVLCPSCRRLWVHWRGHQSAPQEYVPMGGSGADVLH